MRGLFKLNSARIWSFVLIIVGVILLIIAVVLRWNLTHGSDAMVFYLANTAVLIGLGIALVVLGITVIILCNSIAHMMSVYDDELYRRIKNISANIENKN